MFMMEEARIFHQNNEIPFDSLQYDRKLSEGGYGIVYRGKWKHTTVAIKEIKKHRSHHLALQFPQVRYEQEEGRKAPWLPIFAYQSHLELLPRYFAAQYPPHCHCRQPC